MGRDYFKHVHDDQLRDGVGAAITTLLKQAPEQRPLLYENVVARLVPIVLGHLPGPEQQTASQLLGQQSMGQSEEPPDTRRLLTVLWGFITEGLFYPRFNILNSGSPAKLAYLVLTEFGVAAFSNDADNPHRPGFIARLRKRHPGIADEVVERLADASACLSRGLLRPTVVMIGVAAEETAGHVHATLRRLNLVGGSSKKPRQARDQLNDIVAEFANRTGEDGHVLQIAALCLERIRVERNGASHPGDRDYKRDVVAELFSQACHHIPVLWEKIIIPNRAP